MSMSSRPSTGPDARVQAATTLLADLDERDVTLVSDAAIQGAIGALLRLYEMACAHGRREIPPVGAEVSTTAAITLACALARSQALTPFDLALWFSHTAPRASAGIDADTRTAPDEDEDLDEVARPE